MDMLCIENVMAVAIVRLYEIDELTANEAINALMLEGGMTRAEAMLFLRASDEKKKRKVN